MATNILLPFSGHNHDKHSEKCMEAGQSPCAVCGKATTDADNLVVQVVAGGARYATKEEVEGSVKIDEAGDMGCWSVGSTCAKKLRKAGVHLFAETK